MDISINAIDAARRCSVLPLSTVLDVGAGGGSHAAFFREQGMRVDTCDFKDADYIGNYMDLEIDKKYDLVWCSHVLEHQLNVNLFLKKLQTNIKELGFLCVTVPPLKHHIVGGHVTLWNAGLLLYNLILAGFDCSAAMIKTYGYNISVIVRYVAKIELPHLTMDFGDIDLLADFLPPGFRHGFDGRIAELNW